MSKKISIAIDGLVASGKGATAQGVAKKLGYVYLDTGATYRAITRYCLDQGIDPDDTNAIVAVLDQINVKVILAADDTLIEVNGMDITSELRSMDVNRAVGVVAKIPQVREKLGDIQRNIAAQGGVVVDGRDAGTRIIPNAELKVFMMGDITIRAERRQAQLLAKHGKDVPLDEIIDSIQKRDDHDYLGADPTSRKADDARDLDTSHHTLESQIQQIVDRAGELTN